MMVDYSDDFTVEKTLPTERTANDVKKTGGLTAYVDFSLLK